MPSPHFSHRRDNMVPGGQRPLRIALWCPALGGASELLRAAWARRGDCVVQIGLADSELPDASAPRSAAIVLHVNPCAPQLPPLDWQWIGRFRHVFLIEHPRRLLPTVLLSNSTPSAEQIALPQQNRLFERVADRFSRPPLVLDADDFRRSPAALLHELCVQLGVVYDAHMWPPDMAASAQSAEPDAGATNDLLAAHVELVRECMAMYGRLYEYRLHAQPDASAPALELAQF